MSRIPPQNETPTRTIEGAVVGSFFLFAGHQDAGEAVLDHIAAVDPEIFQDPLLKASVKTMQGMQRQGIAIDLATLTHQMNLVTHEFDKLVAHARAACAPQSIGSYISLLRQSKDRMDLQRLAMDALQGLRDPGQDPLALGARLGSELLDRARGSEDDQQVNAGDAYSEFFDVLDYEAKVGRVLFGIPELDAKLKGLKLGMYVILAGPSNAGKSAFVMDLLIANAKAGFPGLFCSLEMGKAGLIKRYVQAVCRETAIDGEFNANQINWIMANQRNIESLPLRLDYRTAYTMPELSAKIRQEVKRHGIKIVAIDFGQLISVPGSSLHEMVDTVSISMRALANDLGILIILLLRYNSAYDENSPPHDRHIFGGAGWKSAADIALHLVRMNPTNRERIKLHATKGRDINFPPEPIDLFLDIKKGLRFSPEPDSMKEAKIGYGLQAKIKQNGD